MVFIEENLSGYIYIDLEATVSKLTTQLQFVAKYSMMQFVAKYSKKFQHDGTPPCYFLPVRHCLNERFPGTWVGQKGAMITETSRSTTSRFLLQEHQLHKKQNKDKI